MNQPTPRVTAQHLQSAQYQGQVVRAVGKLVGVNDGSVQLELAGQGPIANIVGNPGEFNGMYPADAVNKCYYEVIGTQQANNTISQMTACNMGDNFGARPARPFVPRAQPPDHSTPARADMEMYSNMVTLTHQFPELFK